MRKKEKRSREKKRHLERELETVVETVVETYKGTLDWLEQGELRSWVEAGNSPFTNPEEVIHVNGIPLDFIEWHRSARWVTVTETFATELSDRELFDFYTDRKVDPGSLEETRNFLRDAQTFLGCEILSLIDFLKEKGLLYEYLRWKDPAYQTGEEELPFL